MGATPSPVQDPPRTTVPLPRAHRAVLLDRTGGPEVLRVVERPTPAPGAGEVLVRVRAAGVAFAQVMMRHGTYPYAPPFPFTPGAEVVGDVVAVGAGAGAWRVGDRVVAFTSVGGYAEFAPLPAASLVAVPAGLDAATVAALPMNYVTAHQLLHRAAHVRPGESLLVHGAAGGVGTALLELARLAGLRVVGTAAPRARSVVEALGATPLDFTAGDVAARARRAIGGPFDVVLDPRGGDHVLESARALGPGGRLVVYGFGAPGAATPEGVAALRRRIEAWNAEPDGVRASLYSLGEIHRRDPSVVREDLARLVGLLRAGRIAPLIAERVPLDEVRRAHARLESGGVRGKLVLVPDAA